MTDERRAAGDRAEARHPARRIPPLVWIVIFLLLAALAWGWVQRGGQDVTPQGGTMPRQAEGTSLMPAAPANGAAPATPAQTVNGPQEPGRK
jgi:hypothetical protein